ncbi:hypothetical protein PPYR_08586 [Photinus pyralis]|uniref:Tubulin glycylase 3A n=2 Tax=Photinus pyralis TaxID=7054 RepID=A0A1Y1LE01_PHOPY|nr:tubulin glycylase 3A-like [Photinus pyralis]KAB0797593.1 hypothetical protein PPYR_08586 [Photinus pyralis]
MSKNANLLYDEILKDSDARNAVQSAPVHISDSKPTNEPLHRTSSNTEKLKTVITSERLAQLRKCVDDAIKEHKTFTIKGGWQSLRNQFLLRGWIEKFEPTPPKPKTSLKDSNSFLDDVFLNLPPKHTWESDTSYVVKCERTIMSRMLQNHPVDFYWNMKREATDWHHRINTHQIMNRFVRSLFTSKEGLNLLLQQMHWYCEPGTSVVNFPRCYTLGFPDHFNNFIDDFRITSCINLLKWLTKKYQYRDESLVKSFDGKVPHTALQFALDRSNEYLAVQRHADIDRETANVWDHEWDQFLTHYYCIVHEHGLIIDSNEWSLPLFNAAAKSVLNELRKYMPMFDVDGLKNVWILKPGNKCRGRGIHLIKHMDDVKKVMSLKLKYVVQKYIEKPLLIYQTKFDIRQWFMVTSVQPLHIWMYGECYLRFSTQIFNLENFHESLHLTNHAVQCKYANYTQRDKSLPEQNMWDSNIFKNYLKDIGKPTVWDDIIFPGLRENIIGTMLACQDTMDRRANTFELYGADFMLGEDFQPWLLEINSCPDLSPSTNVTRRMCPQCLQDVVKVMIDNRRNPSADTGQFRLVYKQNLPKPPLYLGMSLLVRGRRLFKTKKAKSKESKEKLTLLQDITDATINRQFPKLSPVSDYNGPVIKDFIEDIIHAPSMESSGYEFIPALPSTSAKKKHSSKHERKSKRTRER